MNNNEGKEVSSQTLQFCIRATREEKSDAKAFRCQICGRVHRGTCLIYRVFVNETVRLTLKACSQHPGELEARVTELIEQMKEELGGFVERSIFEYLDTNCLD